MVFKWTSPAIAFGYIDSYFLVFTTNYVEVRDVEHPWKITQLLSTGQQTLVDHFNGFFFAPTGDKTNSLVSSLAFV